MLHQPLRPLVLLTLVSAALAVGADTERTSICDEALECNYKNETIYDRQTDADSPKCLLYDTNMEEYLCRNRKRSDRQCPDGYTLCGALVGESAEPDEDTDTMITSGEASAATEAPPTTEPLPLTIAPPPIESPPQTAQVLTGNQPENFAFPSWIIIALGVVVGAALAVFGSVMYKRRSDYLAQEAATMTPQDDGNYDYNKREYTPGTRQQPLDQTARDTFDSLPSPPPFLVETIPPPPKKSDNFRPHASGNKAKRNNGGNPRRHAPPTTMDSDLDTSVGPLPPFRQPAKITHNDFDTNTGPLPPFRQPAKIADDGLDTNVGPLPPFRTPAAPLRDSYSTLLPDNYEPSKSKPPPKQLPSFKPVERRAPGWGALLPSPKARPQSPLASKHVKMGRTSWATNDFHDSEVATNDFHDEFATNNFQDDFVTSDGSEWLDTNYGRSSSDADLYTANTTAAAASKYGARDSAEDMMTMTRRRDSDEIDDIDMYPDTSLPTCSGGFAVETMTQRDTGNYHADEIVDFSRRDLDEVPAYGRKKEAKDKVAKWKSKYMAL